MKKILLPILMLVSLLANAQNKDLKIKFFCPKWGNESMPWDAFCNKIKTAGFDGVETPIPGSAEEKQNLITALKKYDLLLIGMSFYGPNRDFNSSVKNFENDLRKIAELKPFMINCHTGKDFMPFEQNKTLIESAEKISKETGIKIVHETHRGRFTYAANITKAYLDKIADLKLTLDISHWCNVAESFLDDQAEAVNAAIEHTEHIHSRVGFPEGPQVNDPRAPEWKEAMDKHLAWWDKVIETKRKKGAQIFSITAEFGPSGYLPTLPYTQQPVASQWDINVYMMNLLKKRYSN